MFEIGPTLREARERQALSLTQIERDLKIRARQLQALEEERFDWLPGEAYARSFLRTYADYLGLEWQLYLAEYDSRYRRVDDEPPLVPARTPPPRRRRPARPLALALAAAVAVVVALAAWKLGGTDEVATPIPAPARASRVAHPLTPPPARKPKRAAARPAIAPKHVPKPAPKPKRVRGEVVFTAKRGPCWILVRRGSEQGEQLYMATVAIGRTVSFRGKRLWLRIGAPSSLRTVVNGRVVRLPAGAPVNLLVTPTGAHVL